MYEVVGLSIISGFGAEIMRAFPGITWYREQVPLPQLRYPHFFIHQVSLETTEERKNHWWLRYLINVRYRIAEEPFAVTNLQEQLDTVGLQMLSEINRISTPIWGDISVRLDNTRFEKVDGVLQYFCNVNLQVTEEQEEAIKQQSLELNLNIKE